MIVSTDDNIGSNYRKIYVLLDGIKLQNCVKADDERGYADIHKFHNGKPVIMRNRILVDRIFGNVEICNVL